MLSIPMAAEPPVHDPRRDATLDQIAGHDLPKALFGYLLSSGRMPHALLLHGPAGVGKTSFAWAIAKELLWSGLSGIREGDEGAARRQRLNSRVAREDIHPDIFQIAPSGASGQIRVDDIRAFTEEHAHVTPVEGRYKVLVIQSADSINVVAANTILKLLEEPPSFLRFILVTDNSHRLLETIRSRCAAIRFQPLSEEELAAYLRKAAPDASADDIRRATRVAEGRPGRALDALRLGHAADVANTAMTEFHELGFLGIFRVARDLVALDKRQEAVFGLMLQYFRDQTFCALGQGELALDDRAAAAHRALPATARSLPALMAAWGETMNELERQRNVMQREMQVEALLLRLGKAMRQAV